ncbi:MAG: DUF3006 domain-containing protein [Oscillospiraceae bacterium]|nr:DUF3006 domain-containing protein [Oscillospiraceae bacterium]
MLIIDRFEGDSAVCEKSVEGERTEIKRELLPADAKEGDVLALRDGVYTVDTQATKERRAMIKQRMIRMGL